MASPELQTDERQVGTERLSELANHFGALATDRQRRRFLATHSELRTRQAVEWLSDEVVRLVRVDLKQAEKALLVVRWLADDLDDEYCRGRGYRAEANVSYLKGEYKSALDSYQAAVDSFARLGEEEQCAITRSSALHTLVFLGEYEQAFSWAGKAREAFEESGDRLRLARLEGNFGNILFRQDRWQEAAERFEAAYKEFVQVGEFQDVAICLRNMAVCHASLNKFKEALDSYQRARKYCEENELMGLVLEIDYNIAYLHYLQGEYTLAIQLYRDTRARCEQLGDQYHTALCDLDQSEIFLELNMVHEAGELAQEALTSFHQIDMKYESAKALTLLAIAQTREGKAFLALDLLGKARETFVQERNQVWPALIDLYEALVMNKAGRPLEAMRLAKRALERFYAAALQTKALTAEILLSRLQLENGKILEARERCSKILEILEEAEVPTLECQAYFVLGQIEEACGNRGSALVAYLQAQERLERVRTHINAEELKISLLEDKMLVYESLVFLSLHQTDDVAGRQAVFSFIERAKSRSLADLMAFRAHSLPPTSVSRSDQAKQVRRLREELNWYYRQIDLQEMSTDNRSRDEVRQLREASRRREDHLLRTLQDLQETDHEFSSLQEASTVGLAAIQSFMPADTQLVEYYIARGIIYACIVTKEDLQILPIAVSSRVREKSRLLQFQFSKFRLGRDYYEKFNELIAEAIHVQLGDLYDELILPLVPYLGKRNLVIVPHSYLHRVPFQALFDGSRYLIDKYCISYAPSATVFYMSSVKEVRATGESLVAGVAGQEKSYRMEVARAAARALPGSRFLQGSEVTGEQLRKYGERSRFFFLAVPGKFRGDNPMFSALQLGDSDMSLFDLYHLRLAAELVVLYGCGQGFEESDSGDELVGLTRGLLYAGARSVVTSLWDVEDESSVLFVRSLFAALARRDQRAEALRDAVRTVRERYPNPYRWGPYLLIGESPSGRR